MMASLEPLPPVIDRALPTTSDLNEPAQAESNPGRADTPAEPPLFRHGPPLAATTPARDGSFAGEKGLVTLAWGGMLFAAACFALVGFYFAKFAVNVDAAIARVLEHSQTVEPTTLRLALNVRSTVARIELLSCGALCGMAFGFLGFSLFTLGLKNTMNVDAAHDSAKLKVAGLAPGSLIMLAGIVLAALSVTRSMPVDYSENGPGTEEVQPSPVPIVFPKGGEPP